MQDINRKELTIKTLLILISILSIILIKEGVNEINSSIKLVENMGGFDIYPMDSTDITIRGWYYSIIANILLTVMPITVLILSIVSFFVKNKTVEITIMVQTFLFFILSMTGDENYYRIIETVGYYQLLIIGLVCSLMAIIVTLIVKKKTLMILYLTQIFLLAIKFIGVFNLWLPIRNEISFNKWLDVYGIKYAIIAILGFIILILKFEKRSNTFSKS